MKTIKESEPNFSTEKLNQHPIVQAWADKVASLARVQGFTEEAADAHSNVYKLSELAE